MSTDKEKAKRHIENSSRSDGPTSQGTTKIKRGQYTETASDNRNKTTNKRTNKWCLVVKRFILKD